MNVDWDKICDFVFDTFGDDNAEMARYTIIEFGIDPDTHRPFLDADKCWGCGEGNGNHEEWCPNNDAAEHRVEATCSTCGGKLVAGKCLNLNCVAFV